MPAGVAWGPYLRFSAAAFLTMLAGAQAVHLMYRPRVDLPQFVESERERRRQQRAEFVESERERRQQQRAVMEYKGIQGAQGKPPA